MAFKEWDDETAKVVLAAFAEEKLREEVEDTRMLGRETQGGFGAWDPSSPQVAQSTNQYVQAWKCLVGEHEAAHLEVRPETPDQRFALTEVGAPQRGATVTKILAVNVGPRGEGEVQVCVHCRCLFVAR